MFNRGCRPNLLALIAAQKAQSIQRSVTEARLNRGTVVPGLAKVGFSFLRFFKKT